MLWGEIDRFVHTSRIPLTHDQGGVLVYNHWHIRKCINRLVREDVYIVGTVASTEKRGEGLSGHHSTYTLFICDEASGVGDIAYQMAQGWAKRMLIIGNPNPCPGSFFYRAVKEGDVLA